MKSVVVAQDRLANGGERRAAGWTAERHTRAVERRERREKGEGWVLEGIARRADGSLVSNKGSEGVGSAFRMHGDRKLCIRTLPPGCCIEELRKRTLRESSLPSWGEMRTEGTVVHLGRGSRPVDSPSAGSRARASQRRVSECAKPHPAEEGARARRSNSLRAAGSSSRPRAPRSLAQLEEQTKGRRRSTAGAARDSPRRTGSVRARSGRR